MPNTEKQLIIIAGANGTGKTTMAKELLKEYSVEFLNADKIALSIDKTLKEGKN